MKTIKSIYHFLGSFYFAIIIIVLMAVIVTFGTFAESYTDSHRYAALFTYSNPVFNLVLGAMFINILFSALRRWPYQKSHLPFLITHLGLLMLISGVIVKNMYGIQGNMTLIEGGASHTITIPDTQVIHIEKIDPNASTSLLKSEYPIHTNLFNKTRELGPSLAEPFDELNIELVEYIPHCEEEWESWMKGSQCVIAGLAPFSVHRIDDIDGELPVSSKIKLYPGTQEVWDIYALDTNEIDFMIRKLLLSGTTVELKGQNANLPIESEITFDDGEVKDAFLIYNHTFNGKPESGKIHLLAENLFSKEVQTIKHVSEPDSVFTVRTTPKIAFLRNEEGTITFVAIDRYANIYSKVYRSKQISPLIVYNEGFGGYYASATVPFPAYPYDPDTLSKAKLHTVSKELRKSAKSSHTLTPPLQLIHSACVKSKSDFAHTLAQLYLGKESPDFLQTIKMINWEMLPPDISKACYWSAAIQSQMKDSQEENIPDILTQFRNSNTPMSVQLMPVSHQLPSPPEIETIDPIISISMLRAALQIYDVDLSFFSPNLSDNECHACLIDYLQDQLIKEELAEIFPPINTLPFNQQVATLKKLREEHPKIREILSEKVVENILPFTSLNIGSDELKKALSQPNITLETSIQPTHTALPVTTKLEDHVPRVTVYARKGSDQQFISLAYDPTGEAIKWPILKGEYRLSFQPKTVNIPTTIRLHDARQINYPNTNQPMSYEGDLLVSDYFSDGETPVSISMNNVYESPQGYRFYLGNISPSDESSVQHVQLVVNHDPAKYILTYPGGILIALGTFLLFWFKPKFHGTSNRHKSI